MSPDLFALAPAPLANRVDDQRLELIAHADRVGVPLLVALAPELARQADLPLRFTVVAEGGALAACQSARLSCVAAGSADHAAALLRAEAALLPAALAQHFAADLARAAVPVLTLCAEGEEGALPGAGLRVSGADVRELAALLLLLATRPDIRRGALAQKVDLTGGGRLRVEGLFDSSYSLAIVNRSIALALDAQGLDVTVYSYEQGPEPQPDWGSVGSDAGRLQTLWARSREPQPPAVAMRNAWPPVVRDMRGLRRVLGPYGWEETTFPAQFAADLNRTVDLVTTLSVQTAKLLRDAGVNAPIRVVGAGIDQLLGIEARDPGLQNRAAFRFLHISSCFPRKGADVLLEAWGRAFRAEDDVCLVIKTFPNPHNDTAAQLAAQRAADPGYPAVELIEEDWPAERIAGLYRDCHALVAPSRAEGYGLPLAEAMIHGLPVIATGWGGQMDFCSDETAWLVDYTPMPARTHLAQPDSLWAEPDADSLAARLRQVHGLAPEARQLRTDAARQHILAEHTWRRVGERTLDALRRMEALPLPHPQPRTGWMSTWGSRCGIAAYSGHLCTAIPASQLCILAPDNETPEQSDPTHLLRCWQLGSKDLGALLQVVREQRLDALVIQYHMAFYKPDVLAALLDGLHAAGIQTYVEFHNTRSVPDEGFERQRAVLAACTRLLAHTVDDVQRLKRFGLSDNVTLFPLAVYPVPQPQHIALTGWRDALKLHGKTVLASYGFIMPHKGLLPLLDALPALLQRHPAAHLLMVNAYYSNAASHDELARIAQRIEDLGLRDYVTLCTEFLPEAESLTLLALADLVVFPYQHSEESSSAAVRMALSAGRAVAVTPLPLFADVADAVDTLPGTAPQQMAHGLADLLDRPQPARAAAAARASAHAIRRDARALSARLWRIVQGCHLDALMDRQG